MQLFRNSKIQTKIFIAIVINLMIATALVVYLLNRTRVMNELYHAEISTSMSVLSLTEGVYDGYALMLNLSDTYFMNLGNNAYFDAKQQELNAYFNFSLENFQLLDQLVRNYLPSSAITPHLPILQEYLNTFNNQSLHILNMARVSDMSEFIYHYRAFSEHTASDVFLESIEFILNYTRNNLIQTSYEFSDQIAFSRRMSIGFGVVLYSAAVLIAIGISKPITKSIDKLTDAAQRISHGDVSMDLATNNRDEMSVLLNTFDSTVITINAMLDDLKELTQRYHEKGDVHFRINSTRYENSFKELIDDVNNLIDGNSADMNVALHALSSIVKGEFDIEIKELPGEKIILTQNLRELLSKLDLVYYDISTLATDATRGKLDTQVDPSMFKGSWQELIISLNSLVEAVNTPLQAIQTSLVHMENGHFKKAIIKETFEGTFDTVRLALNNTSATTMRYVFEISRVLKAIADGDLTVSTDVDFVGTYTPIKANLEKILTSLHTTMTDIQQASAQVLSASNVLSDSAVALSTGSSTQRESLDRLTNTIGTINEQALETSLSASEASDKAAHSVVFAKDGNVHVQNMLDFMTNTTESRQDIAKILKSIEDISFQTNLLSLNAAVEAARAGEHGRGFSVVAEEVRMLANKSQNSTKESEKIIASDYELVKSGEKAVNQVEQTFSEIITDIEKISDIVTDISSKSEQQTHSISEIGHAIQEIADVTTNNANTAEESAAAAQELDAQAEILAHRVKFFKL